MADELAKKISELDTLPGGNLTGFFTIGTKDSAGGTPTSYKVDLSVIMTALSTAAAAVSAANTAAANADAARAAFVNAIVQSTGQNTNKVMSQKAATDLFNAITSEVTRITGLIGDNIDAIAAINAKIPTEAASNNQLADKAFVNSSIQSQTANLITYNGGPFPSLEALQQVTASQNDYAYVEVEGAGGTYYDRYKYTDGQWVLEYRINSTVFTAAQWAAVNSNITAALTNKLVGVPDAFNTITTSEINSICV